MYDQLKPFYPKDMGTKKGWCLQNVARGFHVYPSSSPSGSAKEDMQRNKRKGTFHAGGDNLPNASVPVYLDTASVYEHIVVYDHGTWYSDGIRISKPNNIFGWGEWCNGYQIVKKSDAESFLPAKGYWCFGDTDARIGKLAEFMYKTFPAYTNKSAWGCYYGKNLKKSVTEFQRRCHLYPDGCVGRITYAELQKYGFKY